MTFLHQIQPKSHESHWISGGHGPLYCSLASSCCVGTFLESRGPHLGEGGGASPAGWSVSLAFSSSAAPGDKTQDNSSTKRKKTR